MSFADRVFRQPRPTVRSKSQGVDPGPRGIDAHRIVPGLWMGSKPATGRAVAESGFDLLVLCAEEYQPPAWAFPGVDVIHAPFNDNLNLGPLLHEKATARKAAGQVAYALHQGKNVLVTCFAGRNRSGLVTALALVERDHDPLQAIALIRSRRRRALTNPWFVDLIRRPE